MNLMLAVIGTHALAAAVTNLRDISPNVRGANFGDPLARPRASSQRVLHSRCVTGNRPQISLRGLIRLNPALFPIAQSADRNLKPFREFLLRQPECTAHGLHPRHLASRLPLRICHWPGVWSAAAAKRP